MTAPSVLLPLPAMAEPASAPAPAPTAAPVLRGLSFAVSHPAIAPTVSAAATAHVAVTFQKRLGSSVDVRCPVVTGITQGGQIGCQRAGSSTLEHPKSFWRAYCAAPPAGLASPAYFDA